MQTTATISTVKLLENLKVNQIHFASIDVEGFELEVLKGMDLVKMNTLALLIEVRPHNTMPIIDLLVAQNYVLVDSLARFNHIDNPGWDGSHQDYLFFTSRLCWLLSPIIISFYMYHHSKKGALLG